MLTPPFEELLHNDTPPNVRLAALIRECDAKGWTPATSSNFSYRTEEEPEIIFVSKSGLDKAHFQPTDFMSVNLKGEALNPGKPSAETLLHTLFYRLYPSARCVLHVHSPEATVLSILKAQDEESLLTLKGLEILKALRGITTHETEVQIPIVPNTQDIAYMSEFLEAHRSAHPLDYGFLITGHGFYTWGESIEEARRHLNAFQFIFKIILTLEQNGCFDCSR